MYSSTPFFFAVTLIIAFNTILIEGKPVKNATTTIAPTIKSSTKPSDSVKSPTKVPAVKPTSKVDNVKKKPEKKSEKSKSEGWMVPNAAQKKLFNDNKEVLREKLIARRHNITSTYPLQPAKYGSQDIDKTILHHFLIKLPDSKYAHAVIGVSKDAKKSTPINPNHISIRRTVYETLAAAEV